MFAHIHRYLRRIAATATTCTGHKISQMHMKWTCAAKTHAQDNICIFIYIILQKHVQLILEWSQFPNRRCFHLYVYKYICSCYSLSIYLTYCTYLYNQNIWNKLMVLYITNGATAPNISYNLNTYEPKKK